MNALKGRQYIMYSESSENYSLQRKPHTEHIMVEITPPFKSDC